MAAVVVQACMQLKPEETGAAEMLEMQQQPFNTALRCTTDRLCEAQPSNTAVCTRAGVLPAQHYQCPTSDRAYRYKPAHNTCFCCC
jgi:hypothetical protein